MPSPADIAWVAGLFEGEGCIHIRQRGRAFTRRVCVVSTDRDVLEKLLGIVGVGRIRTGNNAIVNPKWKPNHEWMVTKWSEMDYFLRLIYPWLCERRRAKADEMLACPPGAGGRKDQTHCKRGHPLSGPDADVRVIVRGDKRTRVCRVCTRLRNPKGEPKPPSVECKRGHPLVGPDADLYVEPKHGWRTCRVCRRENEQRRTERHRVDHRSA